jgi:hypothetical protein
MSEIQTNTTRDYHDDPRPSWSTVKYMLDCPAAYRWRRDNPPTQTPAMQFGSLVHALILEPETVPRDFHALPIDHNGRTKAGKELVAEIEAAGRTAIRHDVFVDAVKLRDAVRAHSEAARLIDSAAFVEAAFFGQMRGIEARCKPDVIAEDGTVWDLKTTDSLKPALFRSKAARLGYYGQIASNAQLCSAVLGQDLKPGGLIVVQTNGPALVEVLRYGIDAVAFGEQQCHEAWSRLADCLAADVWPGYEWGGEMGVPSWAMGGDE